jgi:hypothetical protein
VSGVRRLAPLAAVVVLGACASRTPAPAAAPVAGTASAADRAAVMGVITGLFDAMRAGDTATMRAAFEPGAALKSAAIRRDGTPGIQTTPIDTWLQGIGRGAPGGAKLDERLRNPVVHVDGPLANVWVEYGFFVGPTFSHCGVDAFVLAKSGADWKIVSVADSRRREGCEGWQAPVSK